VLVGQVNVARHSLPPPTAHGTPQRTVTLGVWRSSQVSARSCRDECTTTRRFNLRSRGRRTSVLAHQGRQEAREGWARLRGHV